MDNKKLDFSDLGATPVDSQIDFSDLGAKPINKTSALSTLGKKVSDIGNSVGTTVKDAGSGLKEDLEDAALGTAQGVTMGGADELGGLLQAITDKAWQGGHKLLPSFISESPSELAKKAQEAGWSPEKTGATDFAGNYREGQQDFAKMFEAAQKRSPKSYLAGNIAGGIAGGVGIGGAAAASGLKTGTGAALKTILANEGKAAVAKEIGKRAAKMAALSAVEGGVGGALTSDEGKLVNATPEEKQKLLADTIGGTVTGGTIGGGLSLAGDVGSLGWDKLKNIVSNKADKIVSGSPLARQFEKAREFGQKGVDLGSEQAELYGQGGMGPMSQLDERHATGLMDRVLSVDKELGQNVGKSIQDATQNGLVLDVTPELNQTSKAIETYVQQNPTLIKDPKSVKALTKILTQEPNITPEEAKSLMDEMFKISKNSANDTAGNTLRGLALDLRGKIRQKLGETIPEYNDAAKRMEEFRRLIPETFLRGLTPEEFSNLRYGSVKDNQAKLYDQMKNVIQGVTKEGTASAKAKSVFSTLNQSLGELEGNEANRIAAGQIKPGEDIFSKLGADKDTLLNQIKDAGDESSMYQTMRGYNPRQGVGTNVKNFATGIVQTGKGQLYRMGNILGDIQSGAPQTTIGKIVSGAALVKKPLEWSQKLYNLTNKGYNKLAQHLNSDTSTTHLGQALQDAINNNDIAKRNAVVFTILQNPKIRLGLSSKDIGENNEQ